LVNYKIKDLHQLGVGELNQEEVIKKLYFGLMKPEEQQKMSDYILK